MRLAVLLFALVRYSSRKEERGIAANRLRFNCRSLSQAPPPSLSLASASPMATLSVRALTAPLTSAVRPRIPAGGHFATSLTSSSTLAVVASLAVVLVAPMATPALLVRSAAAPSACPLAPLAAATALPSAPTAILATLRTPSSAPVRIHCVRCLDRDGLPALGIIAAVSPMLILAMLLLTYLMM